MLSSEKNMTLLGRGSEIYFQLYCYWIYGHWESHLSLNGNQLQLIFLLHNIIKVN